MGQVVWVKMPTLLEPKQNGSEVVSLPEQTLDSVVAALGTTHAADAYARWHHTASDN